MILTAIVELSENLPNVEEAYYRHISRNDAPTCAQGSRDALLEAIQTWWTDGSIQKTPIFWLKGIAGTGKSTIAQTVCQNAAETKHLGATFFFSHQELRRKRADAVFPTLIFQLLNNIDCSDDIKAKIIVSLGKNPSAGKEVIKSQFKSLILEPLSGLRQGSPMLLVLDALDECTETGVVQILNLIKSHIHDLPSFLRIFVTSRPEGYVANILLPMHDNQDKPHVTIHNIDPSGDNDSIRAYLKHALSESEIKRIFPDLDDWEVDEKKIDILVQKSEGLYIVASTLVKHIMHKRVADPALQLDMLIQGLLTKKHTHSAIYRLYEQILETMHPSDDADGGEVVLERFRRVVGSIVVLFEPLSIESLGRLLEENSKRTVPAALSQLQSVIAVTPADNLVRSQHPSFPEFLTDEKSCPAPYHVNRQKQHGMLAEQCFNIMTKLFNDDRDINDIEITAEMRYAIRYWDDHLSASSPETNSKLLDRLRFLVKSQFSKWLDALFHANCILHAIPFIQNAHNWVVSFLIVLAMNYIHISACLLVHKLSQRERNCHFVEGCNVVYTVLP